MRDERRKFQRESSEQRKGDLIDAALSLVAENGASAATVRAISARANVSQGLIRHYFHSKEDLIVAAYEHHMRSMTELTLAPVATVEGPARERLIAFVEASLRPPVVDPRSIVLWASFLVKIQSDPRMKATHATAYDEFRNSLEALIQDALEEATRPASPQRLRHLAIACNAVIDGLWLEGGALPDAFGPEELPRIGVESVGAIIGLDLSQKEGENENSCDH